MENESNNLNDPLLNPTNGADNSEQAPERGGCLTTFLILMMIGNGLTILLYLVMGEKLMRSAHMPAFTPYLMSLFGVLNLIFAFMIYNWKKAGVIGIVINAAIILIVNLALGLGATSFGGIIGVIILIALVNPHWKHFK